MDQRHRSTRSHVDRSTHDTSVTNGRAGGRTGGRTDGRPDGGRPARTARERGIAELRRRALAAGHAMESGIPAIDKAFWERVYDTEHAPTTTDLAKLTEAGVTVTPPGDLDDRALPAALRDLIQALAGIGVYLMFTNHLDDREVYEILYDRVLREERDDLPPSSGAFWVDLLAYGEDGSTGAGDDADVDPYAVDYDPEDGRDATLPRPPWA